MLTEKERIMLFWSKVRREPGDNGCWLWTGATIGGKYGAVAWGGGSVQLAHRVAYFLRFGDIPADAVVVHKCPNLLCVRPDPGHLALETRSAVSRRHANSPKGSRHGQARLIADDVREIRRRGACGDSASIIAADFPVGVAQVWRILNRKRWRHI